MKTALCYVLHCKTEFGARQCPFEANNPANNRATKNSGTTVPQTFQDHSQILSSTTQQHIHAVALSALEMVASQPAIVFQMTNDRLNRLTVNQPFPDPGCNPLASVPRCIPHCPLHHVRDSRDPQTPLRCAVHLTHAPDPRLASRYDRHTDCQARPPTTKLLRLGTAMLALTPTRGAVRLALADALHLWRMQTVKLVFDRAPTKQTICKLPRLYRLLDCHNFCSSLRTIFWT